MRNFFINLQGYITSNAKIKGTALFLIKDVKDIPFYVTQTMFYHGVIYETNIFVSIIKREDPFGVTGFFKEDLAKGLKVFEVQMGYMEMIDVEEILREEGIEERVVFYGLEDISAQNIIWKMFALIKRITPTFINFIISRRKSFTVCLQKYRCNLFLKR